MKYEDKDGRIFYHHDFWECWKSGMYRVSKRSDEKIKLSFDILSDVARCDFSFNRLIAEWPYSSAVHLSNRGINREAWLGQASCCLNHGATEDETKVAWFMLTQEQQNRANQIADYYIIKFEKEVMKHAENLPKSRRFYRCERTYCLDV